MRTCRKCQGSVVAEPFFDDIGSGQALVCLACGERIDNYLEFRTGEMTEEQIRELMEPQRLGRPRSKLV